MTSKSSILALASGPVAVVLAPGEGASEGEGVTDGEGVTVGEAVTVGVAGRVTDGVVLGVAEPLVAAGAGVARGAADGVGVGVGVGAAAAGVSANDDRGRIRATAKPVIAAGVILRERGMGALFPLLGLHG